MPRVFGHLPKPGAPNSGQTRGWPDTRNESGQVRPGRTLRRPHHREGSRGISGGHNSPFQDQRLGRAICGTSSASRALRAWTSSCAPRTWPISCRSGARSLSSASHGPSGSVSSRASRASSSPCATGASGAECPALGSHGGSGWPASGSAGEGASGQGSHGFEPRRSGWSASPRLALLPCPAAVSRRAAQSGRLSSAYRRALPIGYVGREQDRAEGEHA